MIGISMLAFNDLEEFKNFLNSNSVDYIEVVPNKITEFFSCKSKAIDFFSKYSCISSQSILFNVNYNFFKDNESSDKLLKELEKIIIYLSEFGVKTFVFGSPNNRNYKKFGFSEEKEEYFFSKLDKLSARYSINLCIEPIPNEYGCDYINNIKQAGSLINKYSLENIGINLDIGNFIKANDSIQDMHEYSNYILHSHLSEFGLGDIIPHRHHIEIVRFISELNLPITLEVLSKKSTNINRNFKYLNSLINEQIF